MEIKQKTSNNYGVIIIASIITILLSINLIPFNQSFRKSVALGIGPIIYGSNKIATGVNDTTKSISQISTLRQDNSELMLRLAELESENLETSLLLEENALLQSQLKLGRSDQKLVEAQVLAGAANKARDHLLINKGLRDGIQKGDVVAIGNIYVGTVVSVEEYSSKIALPSSKTSLIEVFITEGSSNDQDSSVDVLKEKYSNGEILSKLFKGVALGQSSGVIVENISTQASIEIGDGVIINDPDVNQFLYLGEISDLVDDPAATQKNAFVKSPFNYDDLSYVFVILRND
jgi:rod shape-determining protein MreC